MSAIHDRLLAVWYDGARPPAWARAIEPVYRAVVGARRAAYRRNWLSSGHPGCPVVIVGNITAGGAGKTPLVIRIVQLLADSGCAPAIVSRGYGGAEPRQPHRVSAADAPEFSGDEPLLVAAETGRPVWICRDRLAAARAAAADGADVVVADDGLQHYRLRRDIEIVVIDAARGLGNGRCLPAGPLREPRSRLGEVDAVVCNGTGACPPGALQMSLRGEVAVRIDGSARRPLASFAPGPVHAVAGIGNPERFFDALGRQGLDVIRHPLADHAPVPRELLAPADGHAVMMTSKDAVRCASDPAAGRCWHVPVEAMLGADEGKLRVLLAQKLGLREA